MQCSDRRLAACSARRPPPAIAIPHRHVQLHCGQRAARVRSGSVTAARRLRAAAVATSADRCVVCRGRNNATPQRLHPCRPSGVQQPKCKRNAQATQYAGELFLHHHPQADHHGDGDDQILQREGKRHFSQLPAAPPTGRSAARPDMPARTDTSH